MGKGLGLIGNFRGKVGNVIGYQLKNSKNKVTQGIRAWQPYVKNPQTMPQVTQRAKIQNVNNIYRALEAIISRGFENIEYGAKSRNEFLKLALRREGGPYTVKGSKVPVPGNYTIAVGSLVPTTVSGIEKPSGSVVGFLTNDLSLGDAAAAPANVGEWASLLIKNNSDIENGDQLTFIAVYEYEGAFVYRWASILIDENNTEVFDAGTNGTAQVLSYHGVSFAKSGNNITTAFNVGNINDDETIVAGAVIQSREKGTQGHLRSTTDLWVDTSYLSKYFGELAMVAAYRSYMKLYWNNDWPTQVTDATLAQDSRYSLVTVDVTVTGANPSTLQALAEVNEAGQGHIFYLEDGGQKYLVSTKGVILQANMGLDAGMVYVRLNQYKGEFTEKLYSTGYGTLA